MDHTNVQTAHTQLPMIPHAAFLVLLGFEKSLNHALFNTGAKRNILN